MEGLAYKGWRGSKKRVAVFLDSLRCAGAEVLLDTLFKRVRPLNSRS